MARILLLEDDKKLSKGIKIALEKDDHSVTAVYTYFEGAQAYGRDKFDLFLLDINLPDGDGLMFCRSIRENNGGPVIFITANDTEDDMLEGFRAGCDDYIAKPFSVEVMRQKVLAVLRLMGSTGGGQDVFRYRELEIDFDRMSVSKNGRDRRLTATEYKLLEYMVKNRGKVLTRGMLLEHVFDVDENFIDENTLSVYIRRIRQKLEDDPKNPEYILTVFGIGYTFGE